VSQPPGRYLVGYARRRHEVHWLQFARTPLQSSSPAANTHPTPLSGTGADVFFDMLAIISSRYQYGPFFSFFVAEFTSNYSTTDGLKKISLLPEAPLRPEARGICHICHMVNPAMEAGTRREGGKCADTLSTAVSTAAAVRVTTATCVRRMTGRKAAARDSSAGDGKMARAPTIMDPLHGRRRL